MKIRLFFALLLISVFTVSCRKDIDVPNTAMEKLFGEWDWYETSGGLNGAVYTPYNQYYNKRIKFSDKGIFKSYKNERLDIKTKYELSIGPTLFSDSLTDLITYHDTYGFLGTKEVTSTQSINFWGEDTLILIDESMDGYNHYYVRRN